jgi:hypothetical protein
MGGLALVLARNNRIRLGTFVVTVSSIALLVAVLIPWFTWRDDGYVITHQGIPWSPSGDWSAIAALGFPCVLLVAASLTGLGAATARLTRAFKLPAPTDVALATLGALAVGLVVVALVAPLHPVPGNGYLTYPEGVVSTAAGLYLGLAASVGLVLGALLCVAPFGRRQKAVAGSTLARE